MKIKKILFFSIAFALLAISVVSPVSAVFAETGMDLTMEIKIMKSKRASQAKRELFELFSFCSESNSETGYPNYYSGGYIDDDNVFHACFSDTSNKHFDECYELLSKFGDSVDIEYREHSFAEMQEYADLIADSLQKIGCNLYYWGVSVENNRVRIAMSEDSLLVAESSSASILRNSNIEVVFEEGKPFTFETGGVTLIGGDCISSPSTSFTLGATGLYKGSTAFITCGHSMNKGDNICYQKTSTQIGTLQLVRKGASQSGDFSIGTLNSKFSASHKAYLSPTSTTLWKGVDNAVEGDIVKKYGKTSKLAYAKVTSTNETVKGENGNINGMTFANITQGKSAGGDSGGPYWTEGGRFCGIHSGSKSVDGIQQVMFTPYQTIYNAGFTVYADHDGTWKDYNSTNHKLTCSLCKTTFYEAHSVYYNEYLHKCTRCGRTGNIALSVNEVSSLFHRVNSIPKVYFD